MSENEPKLYTKTEFCKAHNISPSTFYRLVKRGLGPKIIKLPKLVLISQEAAAEWRKTMER